MNHYSLSYSSRSPRYGVSTNYVSDIMLTAVYMLSFNPPYSLRGKYYFLPFTGEDTELREVKQPAQGHTAMTHIDKIQTLWNLRS